ncbi:spore coat protein [Clostridium sp. Marseille-Q2269]|uniref:spore coat protein n=1 Tax=Clostridium sp. Marseille-Q2269 TaxID=2942205 RepID=UPI0020739508|nr:spore coat protein [Clostridium sp. Marseille-Q2269]
MTNLTQKEKYLLEDQKSHEELCIKKYTNYANQSKDPELKQLFLNNAQQEQQHLDSVTQILNGQVPNVNQQQGGQQSNNQQQNSQMKSNEGTGLYNKNDADLCTDLLATEKYVSSTYDTAIFEFRDANIRNVLNHIQKEEQEHGESIFKYMESKGMYNPQ